LQGFAPAGATKGLSDRPLETFGASFLFEAMVIRLQGFAPAGATKGLSDRPLETFGASFLFEAMVHKLAGFRACGRDQRALRSPFGNLRAPYRMKLSYIQQIPDSKTAENQLLTHQAASAQPRCG